MTCEKVSFNSPWILKMYALRQQELRTPLGLNLFEEDLLGEQNEFFFVGYAKGQIITCLQLRKVENKVLKLRQMATDFNCQGKGRGKELVRFSEEWIKKNGYTKIELHARKVAQGFYEKIGYEKVGEEFLEVEIPHFKMEKVL